MEYILAILISVFIFHRKRLDKAGGVENNIKRDNYLLVLSLYYLLNMMIISVFISILKVDNKWIEKSVEIVFNSFLIAFITLSVIFIIKEYYEKKSIFNKDYFGMIAIACFIKFCVWQNFFIEEIGMSELRQFTLFATYVVIWIVTNYGFNKMIREAIEDKRQ